MKRKHVAYLICMVLIPVWSCNYTEPKKETRGAENKILQQEDGIVSLNLEKAGRYCDSGNPSNNTADWNVVISKPGRFNVWLSSATKDTANLKYANAVRISFLDKRLEVTPGCDKIIHNSTEVQYPYFRADSFMGLVYVSEPGEYNIQVISEKVTGNTGDPRTTSPTDDTRLLSVILTPETR